MKNTISRIKEYIDFKGITNQKFEKEVGFSNGAFASQLKNNRTIGVDKLENILKAYSEINTEWLLTGEGEMLKKEKDNTEHNYTDLENLLNSVIYTQQEIIKDQKEKIDHLQAKINRINNV